MSGGSVTGGTGDVKPQWLTASTPLYASANDYGINTIEVPRIVLGSEGYATVMEILRVDWYLGVGDFTDTTHSLFGYLTTSTSRTQDEAATLVSWQNDLEAPQTFAAALHNVLTSTNGGTTQTLPISINMTDANGNGMLIAADRFFMVTSRVSNVDVGGETVKILYRMVAIDIVEYVGIVQSQS